MSDSASRVPFGPVAGATVTAKDISRVAASYTDYLGYRITAEGTVSPALADAWGTPAHAGTPFISMQPESGARQWIRLIEAEPVPGYMPMTTFGWHSLEIVVDNVDAIPPRLEGSPWQIIGEPHNLSMSKTIRAMQVQGLAPEVLYLTQTNPHLGKEHLPAARSFIDRIFIVVLGSPSLDDAMAFYTAHFDVEPGVTADAKISVLNRAYGLDPDTTHRLATVKMRGKCLIEIDDYPKEAKPRATAPDSLPPGVAMVAFAVDSLDDVTIPFLAPPLTVAEGPYNGARVAVGKGVAGELIELVEG